MLSKHIAQALLNAYDTRDTIKVSGKMQAAVLFSGREKTRASPPNPHYASPSQTPNPSELTTQSAAASKRPRIPRPDRSPEGPISPHSNSQTPGIGREMARRPRRLARVYGPRKRIR